MSTTMRIIFYGLVGVVGGLLAWPLVETLIALQSVFPSQLVYCSVVGAVVGLFMGGVFGMTEGLIQKSNRKLMNGLVTGLVIGFVGGVIGMLAGQQALLVIGTSVSGPFERIEDIGNPAAKALGWAVLGIFIGIVEGVRSRSIEKIRNGLIGGLIGGFLGGFVFHASIELGILAPFLSRLVGLAIMGFFIGIFYGFIENKLARAVLLSLNGPEKGKEFLITQRLTTIGGDEEATMTVAGYTQIAPEHAVIRRKRNEITLLDKNSKTGTFVNDKKVTETVISDGDVIRVGDAQFLFRKK